MANADCECCLSTRRDNTAFYASSKLTQVLPMIAWASSGADLIIQNNCALQKLKVNSLSAFLCEEYWMVNLSFYSVLRIKLFIESKEYPWSWMHRDEDDGFVNAYHLFGARILPTIIFSVCFINTTAAVCSNWNLCIHSYTTHSYLLNDSEWRSRPWCIHLIRVRSVHCVPFSLNLFRVTSAIHEMNKMARKMKGLP